jgi:hypothetical protein
LKSKDDEFAGHIKIILLILAKLLFSHRSTAALLSVACEAVYNQAKELHAMHILGYSMSS